MKGKKAPQAVRKQKRGDAFERPACKGRKSGEPTRPVTQNGIGGIGGDERKHQNKAAPLHPKHARWQGKAT